MFAVPTYVFKVFKLFYYVKYVRFRWGPPLPFATQTLYLLLSNT